MPNHPKQTRTAALIENALATTAYPKKSVSTDIAETLVERLDHCAKRLGLRKAQIIAEAIRDSVEEIETAIALKGAEKAKAAKEGK